MVLFMCNFLWVFDKIILYPSIFNNTRRSTEFLDNHEIVRLAKHIFVISSSMLEQDNFFVEKILNKMVCCRLFFDMLRVFFSNSIFHKLTDINKNVFAWKTSTEQVIYSFLVWELWVFPESIVNWTSLESFAHLR